LMGGWARKWWMAVEGSRLGCMEDREPGGLWVLLGVEESSLTPGRSGNHWGVMWKWWRDGGCRMDCSYQ
jgi:hypothetical protein